MNHRVSPFSVEGTYYSQIGLCRTISRLIDSSRKKSKGQYTHFRRTYKSGRVGDRLTVMH